MSWNSLESIHCGYFRSFCCERFSFSDVWRWVHTEQDKQKTKIKYKDQTPWKQQWTDVRLLRIYAFNFFWISRQLRAAAVTRYTHLLWHTHRDTRPETKKTKRNKSATSRRRRSVSVNSLTPEEKRFTANNPNSRQRGRTMNPPLKFKGVKWFDTLTDKLMEFLHFIQSWR